MVFPALGWLVLSVSSVACGWPFLVECAILFQVFFMWFAIKATYAPSSSLAKRSVDIMYPVGIYPAPD